MIAYLNTLSDNPAPLPKAADGARRRAAAGSAGRAPRPRPSRIDAR